METSQFEGKKVALKQTKEGHVLTLSIHPDEIPEEILRDFVGARYMVVMVRLGDDEKPANREEYAGASYVKLAGMLCRDPRFWDFLYDQGHIFAKNERETTEWIYDYLGIPSRSELKTNQIAQELIKKIGTEYKEWLHVR
jgi:hypothetical protein